MIKNKRNYIEIDGRKIGNNYPPYIIAELSGNHNKDINRAFKLIEIAKESGVDAVKIQTYTADTMTIKSNKEDFLIKEGPWQGYTLYDLYEEAHTPWEWHADLFKKARSLELTIFSTPFDDKAVNFLESLGCPAYKVASFEIVDIPLIERIANTGKPVIISTGMADLTEIKEALTAARDNGATNIALLHCISAYPTPYEEVDLKTITDLAKKFKVVTGLSDHTLGIEIPVAAVALGASLIEKHVTISHKDGGPDALFSIDKNEIKELALYCRNVWCALGKVTYEIKSSEKNNLKFRRSLYVVKDMKKGDVFDFNNVGRIRPGYGLNPKHFNHIIGKIAKCNITKGTPLSWDIIGE